MIPRPDGIDGILNHQRSETATIALKAFCIFGDIIAGRNPDEALSDIKGLSTQEKEACRKLISLYIDQIFLSITVSKALVSEGTTSKREAVIGLIKEADDSTVYSFLIKLAEGFNNDVNALILWLCCTEDELPENTQPDSDWYRTNSNQELYTRLSRIITTLHNNTSTRQYPSIDTQN